MSDPVLLGVIIGGYIAFVAGYAVLMAWLWKPVIEEIVQDLFDTAARKKVERHE